MGGWGHRGGGCPISAVTNIRSKKKKPKHKVFGRDIPGTSGTQTSGYPGQKLYVVLDREWPGCPGILGRDVPDLEKLCHSNKNLSRLKEILEAINSA